MALLTSIGGNGYTDAASISAHPTWSAPFPDTAAVVRPYLVGEPAGERWFEATTSTDIWMNSGELAVSSAPGWEASCAVYLGDENNLAGGVDAPSIMTVMNKSFGTLTPGVYVGTSDGSIKAGHNSVGYYPNEVADYVITEHELHYITLRITPSSGGTAFQQQNGNSDGAIEVWANGVLAFKATNLLLGWYAQTNATALQLRIRAYNEGNTAVSNATLYDAFTTTAGTAPTVTSVTDTAGFNTTVTTVPLSYYGLRTTLKSAISGNGYTDNTSINANPNWSTLSTVTSAVSRSYLESAPAGEKWFESATDDGLVTLTGVSSPTHIEASFGYRRTGAVEHTILNLQATTSGGTDQNLFEFITKADGDLKIINSLGPGVDIVPSNTAFNFAPDRVYYITMRFKYKDTTTFFDKTAILQVWVDGALVYEEDNQNVEDAGATPAVLDQQVTFNTGANNAIINATVHDAWQTDQSNPSPILYVIDEAGFDTTVARTDKTYYYVHVGQLVAAIAGEAYGTNTSINAHPDWTSSNTSSTAVALIDQPAAGQKWFAGSSGALSHVPVGTPEFVELSFARVFDSGGSGSTFWQPFADFGWSFTASNNIVLQRQISTGDIRISSSIASITDEIVLGNIADDHVGYFTLRVKPETANGNDGAYELWLDGVLLDSGTDLEFGTTLDQHTFMNAIASVQLTHSTEYFKNITVYDGWSSSAGVAPIVRAVEDGGPGLFTETVTDVPLTYYTLTLPLVLALAGEGYTDAASISAHPLWDANSHRSSLLQVIDLPSSGQRWFEAGSFNFGFVEAEVPATTSPGYAGIEVSCAYYPTTGTTTNVLRYTWGGTRVDIGRAGNGDVRILSNTSFGNRSVTGNLPDGQVGYFTLRLRPEVGGNNEGTVEMWMDGVLLDSIANISWSPAFFSDGSAYFLFEEPPSSSSYVKNMTVHDDWSSAPTVAPKVWSVTDDGSSTETVAEVTLAYYAVPEIPVPFLGGEGYTDNASIIATPGWSNNTNDVSAVSQQYLAAAPAGEKWFQPTVSGFDGDPRYNTGVSTPNEIEFSYGFRIHDLTNNAYLAYLRVDTTTTTNVGLLDFDVATNGELEVYDLNAQITGGDIGGTPFVFVVDRTYYITHRVRYDTPAAGGDLVQLWVDGVLVFEKTQTLAPGVNNSNIIDSIVEMCAYDSHSFVNVTVYDDWQAADAVASPTLKVTDGVGFNNVPSVVQLSYYRAVQGAFLTTPGFIV